MRFGKRKEHPSRLLRCWKMWRMVRRNFPKEQRLDLKSKEYFLPGHLVPVRENGKVLYIQFIQEGPPIPLEQYQRESGEVIEKSKQ